MAVKAVVHPEAATFEINGIPFTQRMFDNLVFMQVHHKYPLKLIQSLFQISHGVNLTPQAFAEALSRCGYGLSIWPEDEKKWHIDGISLSQRMCDHIVFMHSNRRYQWKTIANFFELSHNGIKLTPRIITQVLQLHDWYVNNWKGNKYEPHGPVHKHPMHRVVSRAPVHVENDQKLKYYEQCSVWHKEYQKMIDSNTGEEVYCLNVPRMRYNWGKYTPGD